jgi:hypothetical protein
MVTPETAPSQSAPQVNVKHEESCRSCLYTGVVTCVGLSGYFFHLAMEEQQSNSGGSESSPRKPCAANGGNRIAPVFNRPSENSNKIRISTSFQTYIMDSMRGNQVSPKNRPFLLAMSAVWGVAGAYRLYLN